MRLNSLIKLENFFSEERSSFPLFAGLMLALVGVVVLFVLLLFPLAFFLESGFWSLSSNFSLWLNGLWDDEKARAGDLANTLREAAAVLRDEQEINSIFGGGRECEPYIK